MSDILRRLNPAITLVALAVALLALVAAASGAGYAAATIGTADIKNNAITAKKLKNNAVKTKKIKNDAVTSEKIQNDAVTSEKVQNGSLTANDLVANEVQKPAPLSNGGDGDCAWTDGGVLVPGTAAPAYRKDRFGTVHLTGLAAVSDAPGGDGDCDFSAMGQSADAIVFVLPAGYIPAKTVFFGGISSPSPVIVVGPQGLVSGDLVLPPGAVATGSAATVGIVLDGIYFEPAGSSVVIPKMTASGQFKGTLAETLGLE